MDGHKSINTDYKIRVAYAADHIWFAEPVKERLEKPGV